MNELNQNMGNPVPQTTQNTVTNNTIIASKVKGTKGWLKFLGIFSIVIGAIYALTIIGIVIAWLPIWLGVILVQAASRADEYLHGNESSFIEYLDKIKQYFTISGVIAIIGLIGMAIWLIVFIIIIATGGIYSLSSMFNNTSY